MTEKRAVVSIGDALASFFSRRGLTKRLEQVRVLDEWPELVGTQIAAVTEPLSVSPEGILRVRVATAPWAAELGLMTPRILARINRERKGRISGIRWIPGDISQGQRTVHHANPTR
jgi:predicted nucleic acid-binding Zn ribbon protein